MCSLELKLPVNTLKNIRGDARRLLASTALDVSRILGKVNAARAPTIALTMSSQDYNITLYLSNKAREELQWWTTHFSNWNGQNLIA